MLSMRTGNRRGAFTLIAHVLVAVGVLISPLARSALPPLMDRNLFVGEPEISSAQVSPDGRFLAFLKPLNGTRNIWVKGTGESFERARPITSGSVRPVTEYFWSRDSKYILFSQDVGGDENRNIYAVNPRDPAAPGGLVPAVRNLTRLTGASSDIYALPKKFPDLIFVGMNNRDKDWYDVYSIHISTGKRALLRRNDIQARDWIFDLDGALRLAVRSAENGDSEILRLDGPGATKIYGCMVVETCSAIQFHSDGKHVYLTSNQGTDVDLAGLVLLNVQDGSRELIESDPEGRVDLADAIFSPVTDRLIATRYVDERGFRWRWRDSVTQADFEQLRARLPDRDLDFAATADDGLWLVEAHADTEPGETYLFDRHTKTLTLQFRVFGGISRSALAHTTSVSYASSDGLTIPAYLTLPQGVDAKALPLVVMPHGGPWARDQWGYISFAQFLANRGLAVLQPNFRGSSGYGKKFLNAGNKQWGERMQDDITWGVRYLVAQGIADPKRVGILGSSYGGYATLAGVAFTPELYSAAVSWVGPSNLPTVLDSLAEFAGPWRQMFYERIGDPTSASGRAQLERQSPLNFVGAIRTPLLIIQGANDPRVKRADSDRIVVALRDHAVPVRYLVAPDEGHVLGIGQGFARPVNNQAIFAALEQFLAQYLGTRHQDAMEPDVAQRLKELTVDTEGLGLKGGGSVK